MSTEPRFTTTELIRKFDLWERHVPQGSTWRHRKGTRYIVCGHCLSEALMGMLIVYAQEDVPRVRFSRPAQEFLEVFEREGA